MEELRLYNISDKYINYLLSLHSGIYDPKIDNRAHTRKYVGIALNINGYCYYIPLSSPKSTDFRFSNGQQIIRKSIVPIIRITSKNSEGIIELKGTLRISHMIPVPASELNLYDVDNETDLKYKDLIQQEIIFIRKKQNLIRSNAQIMYNQKLANDASAGYVKTALDFRSMERSCDKYISKEPFSS